MDGVAGGDAGRVSPGPAPHDTAGPGCWLARARRSYARACLRCPVNLRWKVWLAGARTELGAGNAQTARALLNRALTEVPDKSRAQVLLECARLEEYTGCADRARAVLRRGIREEGQEWKMFLELVMLEVRGGRLRPQAVARAEEALALHTGTGRLWAVLVQLKHSYGPVAQRRCFLSALKEVPKSGEVPVKRFAEHFHTFRVGAQTLTDPQLRRSDLSACVIRE